MNTAAPYYVPAINASASIHQNNRKPCFLVTTVMAIVTTFKETLLVPVTSLWQTHHRRPPFDSGATSVR